MERTTSRSALPTGTVTFLVADLWPSTRSAVDPDEDAAEVRRHLELLAEVASRSGGTVTATQHGRNSVVAFARPSDAAAVALDVQRALAQGVSEHAMRMAIHTGEAQLREPGSYYGDAVGRAVRLQPLGHGGQVLLSRPAVDVVGENLPEGATLMDLGSHRLRDLGRPEHVFQLCHDDLETDFPPLASLDALPNNLPVQLTTFIGRDQELAEVERLVTSNRFVTLTGPGGCGKTRLAAQVVAELVDRYREGAWWVELAPLSDPSRVGQAALAAVGIRSSHGLDPADRLVEHFGKGRAIVVFDNCEHVLGAVAPLIEDLLRRAPGVDVVATSRETVAVPGEVVWRVPPLSLPPAATGADDLKSLTMYDAVRLFVDRAQRARPDFAVTNETAAAVAEVCARLDGIPLAIELAAARVQMMGAHEILGALDDRFRLLTGGGRTVMARQQTLHASVQWSYDLLSDDERVLLRRLSVFAGSFSLDDAERVCGLDPINALAVFALLSHLVDKSLVVADHDAVPVRYRLLESIRQFAAERLLEAKETAPVRDEHLAHYTALAKGFEPDLERGRVRALDAVEVEHANIRAALDWAGASGRHDDAVRIVASLSLFWSQRGYYDEGQKVLLAALADASRDATWAKASCGLANLRMAGMDVASGFGYGDATAAAEVAATVGDEHAALRAVLHMGLVELFMGSPMGEERVAEVARRAEAVGDEWAAATALSYAAISQLLFHDRHTEARPLVDRLRSLADRTGGELPRLESRFLEGVGHLRQGQLRAARGALEEAVRLSYQLGDPAVETFVLEAATDAALAGGDAAGARSLLDASAGRMLRSAPGRIEVIRAKRATVMLADGDPSSAKAVFLSVLEPVRQLGGVYFTAATLIRLARAELATGDTVDAAGHLDEALAVARHGDLPWFAVQAMQQRARVDIADDVERAEERVHEALALAVERGLLPLVAGALDGLGAVAGRNGSHVEAARLLGAAEALRATIGWALDADVRVDVDTAVDEARQALGREPFEAAWKEGAELKSEDAVAYARRARGERKRPSSGWSSLTPTELQVVALAVEGLTNAEIARKLFVSPATVKTHLAHVYSKLAVNNRAQLTAAVHRRAAPG